MKGLGAVLGNVSEVLCIYGYIILLAWIADLSSISSSAGVRDPRSGSRDILQSNHDEVETRPSKPAPRPHPP